MDLNLRGPIACWLVGPMISKAEERLKFLQSQYDSVVYHRSEWPSQKAGYFPPFLSLQNHIIHFSTRFS